MSESEVTLFDGLGTRFPGKAGELQDAGDAAAVIKELSANYDLYHRLLQESLTRLGRRPEIGDYDGRYEDYLAASQEFHDLILMERVLRNFSFGAALTEDEAAVLTEAQLEGVKVEAPLVDAGYRLVDARTGRADESLPSAIRKFEVRRPSWMSE